MSSWPRSSADSSRAVLRTPRPVARNRTTRPRATRAGRHVARSFVPFSTPLGQSPAPSRAWRVAIGAAGWVNSSPPTPWFGATRIISSARIRLPATLEPDAQAAAGSARARCVTDIPPEKSCLVRAYCPGCEPDADIFLEILEVRWCEAHEPARGGLDDAAASARGLGGGSAEAGGEDNRRWCELIHGSARARSVLRRRRRAPR